MERLTRYNRFDPITVRAAARLVRLQQLGRLGPGELDWFLRELTMLVPGCPRLATRELLRLATRQAAFGRTGVAAQVRHGFRRAPGPQPVEKSAFPG